MNKNLKNEYPDVPANFHNRILSAVNSIPDFENRTVIRRHSPLRIAALAAALIVLLTVTVFAGNEVYERFIKKDNYKVTLELGEESSKESAEYVKLNFDYMPDYLEPFDEPYKYSIGDDLAGGLTFQLFKSELAKELEITYVGSVEECMFGKYKGAVIRIDKGIEFEDEAYRRNFVIYFDDFGYVLRCYVSDSISDEEMMKIANGLSLEETDKEHAFLPDTYIPGVEVVEGASEGMIAGYKRQTVDAKLGETVDMHIFSGGDKECDYSVTVKNFEIRDNVSGFDYSSFYFEGDDIAEYIDENGNLKDYERKTYEYGDGVNTLDTLKESKTVGRKIIIVNIEIENKCSYAYKFYSQFCLINGDCDYIDADINYISGQVGGSGSYYFIPFEAYESRTVTFGFVVDSDADLNGLNLEMKQAGLKYCRVALTD